MIHNKSRIDNNEFAHISGALGNFEERYLRGIPQPVANDPMLLLAREIEAAVNSKTSHIDVTHSVHNHAPYAAATLWFTFDLRDPNLETREFHIFVQADLWQLPPKQRALLTRRISNADDPQVPPGAPGAIGSWHEALAQAPLTWIR